MPTYEDAAGLIESYAASGVTVPYGTYRIQRTLGFNSGDRLRMAPQCVLRIEHTGTALLIDEDDVQISGGTIWGGPEITFSDTGEGVWTAPFDASANWKVSDLFRNGVRVPMSEWPPGDGWCGTLTDYTNTSIYALEDLPGWDASEWINYRYYAAPWISRLSNLLSESAHEGLVSAGGPLKVLNNRNALTAGSFCHDYEADELVYMPAAGESLASSTFILPSSPILIDVAGGPGAQLTGIVIEGVRLIGARWGVVGTTSGPGYQPAGFAAANGCELLRHKFATGTIIRNCLLHFGGGRAIWLGKGTEGCHIHHNRLEDCYGAALVLGEYGVQYTDPDITRECLIEHNKLLRCGLLFPGCALVPTAPMQDITLHYNELAYCGYSGVSMNATYPTVSTMYNLGVRNNFRFNKIHDVMKLTRDGGGIYAFYPQLDSNWSYNYFYNIEGCFFTGTRMDRQSGGLYLDQSCVGVTYEYNLFHDCKPWPVRINWPHRCTARGNKWVHSGDTVWAPIGMLENIGSEVFCRPGNTSRQRALQAVTDNGDGTMDLFFAMDSMNYYALNDAAFTVIDKVNYGGYDCLKVTTPVPAFTYWAARATANSQWPCMQVAIDGAAAGVMSTTCTVISTDNGYQYMRYNTAGTTTDPLFVGIGIGDHIKNPMIPSRATHNWGSLGYDTGKWFIYVLDGTKQGATYPCVTYGIVDETTFWIRIKTDSAYVGASDFTGLAASDHVQMLMHYLESNEQVDSVEMAALVAAWEVEYKLSLSLRSDNEGAECWFDFPENSPMIPTVL